MDLIFLPNRGNPFYLEVGYFDTILEIKEKIQKFHGIPTSKQTLSFNGKTLHDELNIHSSDILDRSRIHLLIATEFSSSSKIQLLLKMPTSKQGISIEMDINETIRRLKEKIYEIEGIPISRLVINSNGIELHDHKSIHEYDMSDNEEIIVAVRSSPVSSSSNGTRKLRIIVFTKCCSKKIPLEVNSLDNVGELRKKLEIMKEQLQFDLPQEGYFFIYKQNVMDDDRSFKWHHVGQGDTIEIFSGSVSGGS
ncbi:hypothetical protein ACJIZ3_023323 [Penstemon smallii]|uniref:Ubiquitin-like domain-containing protein n=1 Tax=Penstemon smallii TaxID=265156 RepID=A0ABD3TR21_9LAMI